MRGVHLGAPTRPRRLLVCEVLSRAVGRAFHAAADLSWCLGSMFGGGGGELIIHVIRWCLGSMLRGGGGDLVIHVSVNGVSDRCLVAVAVN